VPFGTLRCSHKEAYVKTLAGTLAASTVKTRVAYVRIVLRAAMLDRRLAYDPLEGVKLPAVRKTEHAMRIPTGAEVAAIREHLDPAYRALVDVMAYAGLRIGEAAGLQLADVGFLPSRSTHVERQIQNRGASASCPSPTSSCCASPGTSRRSACTATTGGCSAVHRRPRPCGTTS
jgi:site-specific recombinase XerC